MTSRIGRRLIAAMLFPIQRIERSRGWRRLAWLGVFGGLGAGVHTLALRQASLRGLPDVGDPFDVAAFVAEVPEDEDAFGLFDRALDALDDRDLLGMTQALQASRRADWTSDTELRGWVDRNRQAMRLWRLGTERARSRPPWLDGTDVDSSRSGIQRTDRLIAFAYLALLEAARLERDGDLVGAWGWYRAMLRGGFLSQCRGGIFERLRGGEFLVFAADEAAEWAADPRVDTAMLDRAIADVRAASALILPNAETHRAEYLMLMRVLDDSGHLRRLIRRQEQQHGWSGPGKNPEDQWHDFLPGSLEARWWLRREPDRSRRVVRIAYTNWLAHCDVLRSVPPPLDGRYPELFVTDPTRPWMARIMPAALDGWFDSSLLWEGVGIEQPNARDNWQIRERSRIATLLATLNTERDRRLGGPVPDLPEP